jgi:hypothetical protein
MLNIFYRISYRIKLVPRYFRLWWQRIIRGWDDSETWSLDHSLAKLILPRLKRFKELNIGRPHELTWEQWNEYLDQMIQAFEWLSSESYWDFGPESELKSDRAQQGLDIFSKYYMHLWW